MFSFRTTSRSNPAIGLTARVSIGSSAKLERVEVEGAPSRSGLCECVGTDVAWVGMPSEDAPLGVATGPEVATEPEEEDKSEESGKDELFAIAEFPAGAAGDATAGGAAAGLRGATGLTALPATTRGPGSNDSNPRPNARRFSGAAGFSLTSPAFSATFVMLSFLNCFVKISLRPYPTFTPRSSRIKSAFIREICGRDALRFKIAPVPGLISSRYR